MIEEHHIQYDTLDMPNERSTVYLGLLNCISVTKLTPSESCEAFLFQLCDLAQRGQWSCGDISVLKSGPVRFFCPNWVQPDPDRLAAGCNRFQCKSIQLRAKRLTVRA